MKFVKNVKMVKAFTTFTLFKIFTSMFCDSTLTAYRFAWP